FLEVSQSARIPDRRVRVAHLGFQRSARCGSSSVAERALVALHGERDPTTSYMDIAYLLVDRSDLVDAIERLGGLARLLQDFKRVVVRKHALGIARRAPRIRQRSREVAREPEVVSEVLRMLVRARSLGCGGAVKVFQRFADA